MENSTLKQPDKLELMLNDCSIDAIMAIDRQGNIIAWNAAAEKIYGKARSEVIGMPLSEIIPSISKDEESLKAIEQAQKGFKSFVPSSRNYYHRMHAENHFIPLTNDAGIRGVMNLVHDVSHRIKAEEELQYLNEKLSIKNKELELRNEELLSLSRVAGNDLKEPLRRIYTAAEAIITGDARQLSNNGRAHLRRIQSGSQRMGLILEDLLAFATIAENEREFTTVNLNEVLEKAKQQLQKYIIEKNATIDSVSLPEITGEFTLLVQLFKSIIHNSIKFQHDGNSPEIKITSSLIKDESLKDYVMISFGDNGVGFNQEEAETVFNLFTKLHDDDRFRGSGSGLAISKKIIELHGGNISAVSKVNDGTTIHCSIPIKEYDQN